MYPIVDANILADNYLHKLSNVRQIAYCTSAEAWINGSKTVTRDTYIGGPRHYRRFRALIIQLSLQPIAHNYVVMSCIHILRIF